MSERLLRLSVAGKRLGDVTAKTVQAWIRRGKIAGVKLPSGHWRVPEREIERYINEHVQDRISL